MYNILRITNIRICIKVLLLVCVYTQLLILSGILIFKLRLIFEFSILLKFILSCWDMLVVTQEPLKFKKSMSQNDDPKMAISIGILQYRRARRGVPEGR